MRRHLTFWLVLFGLLIVAARPPHALSQSDDHGLIVAQEPGGPKADLHLRIAGDATSASTYLYVRHTGAADLPGIHLFAELADKQNQPISGISTTLSMNGTDVSAAGLLVPANKQVRVMLLVNNLTATGTFTGHLVMQDDNNIVNLVPLVVEHYPSPALTIVGASATTGIQLTQPTPNFHYQFRIESGNRGPVDALNVSVAPLVGANAVQVAPIWSVNGQGQEQSVSIAGLGSATLDISATLPLTGTYTSAISLIYADKRESTPLVIQRARPQPPVEVLGIETANAEYVIWNGNADLWLTLHELAGLPVKLNAPMLTTLTRNGTSQDKNQAQYDGVQVTDDHGAVLSPTLTLDAGNTQRLKLTVLGLRDAGSYTGNLRISAPNMLPIDRQVTVLMKLSGVRAALLILLGVITSAIIRNYVKTRRPRLVLQRRAWSIRSDLETLADSVDDANKAEREVIETLSLRLERLARAVELGDDQDAEAKLNEIDAKITCIPDWINLRRRVDALRPPELGVQFRTDLEQIAELLKRSDPALVEKVKTKLAGLPEKIDEAIKQAFIQQVDTVIADIQAQIDKPPAKPEIFTDILEKMNEAKKTAEKGNVDDARLKFDDACRAFAEARARYNNRYLLAARLGLVPALPEAPHQGATIGVPARVHRFQDQLKAIRREILVYDRLLTFAVACIAVILGLQLLWISNAVWGSVGDQLAAFLWGLGLHQVSGAAFGGPAGLQQQIVGT